jgi:hypothetical protein
MANARAESPVPSVDGARGPNAPSAIREELKKKVIADAVAVSKASQNENKVVIANLDFTAPVTMSPYIVREARPPEIIKAPSGVPIIRWLKDGTLYDRVGETFTIGAKLTFYETAAPPGGNIKPVGGVKVGLSWSW